MSEDTKEQMAGWVTLPVRGFCYECCGMMERLVYEIRPNAGVGLCRACFDDINRTWEADDEDGGRDEDYER